MDYLFLIKAGFIGFCLCLGVLMLSFYLVGVFLPGSRQSFIRVFVLGATASFVVEYLFLRYRLPAYQAVEAQLFLAGCVGGWLGGIFSGLTSLKRVLLNMKR